MALDTVEVTGKYRGRECRVRFMRGDDRRWPWVALVCVGVERWDFNLSRGTRPGMGKAMQLVKAALGIQPHKCGERTRLKIAE